MHNESSIKPLIEASVVITPIFINQIIHNITNIAYLKVECKVSSAWWNSAVFAVIAIGLLSVLSWYILIARFMGPTWGPSGAGRTQMGFMLAPWTSHELCFSYQFLALAGAGSSIKSFPHGRLLPGNHTLSMKLLPIACDKNGVSILSHGIDRKIPTCSAK